MAAKRGVPCSVSALSLSSFFCPLLSPWLTFSHCLLLYLSPLLFLPLNLFYSEEKWLDMLSERSNTAADWICRKGAWLSPLGSPTAALWVPRGEEGLGGGSGVAEKNQCTPCHSPGLVTGPGGLRRAGKPEKGQMLAPSKAGHPVRPPPRRSKQPEKGHLAPVKSRGSEAAA